MKVDIGFTGIILVHIPDFKIILVEDGTHPQKEKI
jgi:hypothetical protein